MWSLVCAGASSDVEVAGVVDGVAEPTCEELKVDAETRCDKPLPFCPFAWPSANDLPCFPLALVLRLLFLRKVLRNEGMSAMLWRWEIGWAMSPWG